MARGSSQTLANCALFQLSVPIRHTVIILNSVYTGHESFRDSDVGDDDSDVGDDDGGDGV